MDNEIKGRVVEVTSLAEYFTGALQSALSQLKVAVDHQAQHYVVNLLTLYSRSEALYEETPEGLRLRPLALMLKDAVEAPGEAERTAALQRLGDVSLFIAGFFSRSFARRLVDVDYHIALGGRAYASLADRLRGRRAVLGGVFGELATKFQPLVDALNEVSDCAHEHSQADVLRLYEQWLKTGSPRARGILRRLGVEAVPGGHLLRSH
jgi:hypothetical protein